jgi:hypothetical protein
VIADKSRQDGRLLLCCSIFDATWQTEVLNKYPRDPYEHSTSEPCAGGPDERQTAENGIAQRSIRFERSGERWRNGLERYRQYLPNKRFDIAKNPATPYLTGVTT